MKVCGVVVLYNPEEEIYDNISSYICLLDELIIFDNSNKEYSRLNELNKKIKVKYISYNENKGIAFALKKSLEYAIEQKYDWCLTMDQDSSLNLNEEMKQNVFEILDSNKDAGIISFDYNNDSDIKLRKVTNWITSGNFINIEKYKIVDGFNEDLFIDFVDFDLCHQFYKKNINLYVMNYSINHNIGNPKKKKFLFWKISSMNHNPIRYYYRYRNCYYLYKKDKKYYYKKLAYEFIINFSKMLLIEDDKKAKIQAVRKGIKDAKKGIIGNTYKR